MRCIETIIEGSSSIHTRATEPSTCRGNGCKWKGGRKGPCNSPCRGPKGGRGMEGEKAPAIALLGGQRVEEEGREKRPLNENKPLSLCDRCYGCEAHL